MSKPALIVIDPQNDYFAGGLFPLVNTDAALEGMEGAIAWAQREGAPVVLVQHVADPEHGIAPFFNVATQGVEIHPRILRAAPEAHVVVKRFADSFEQTNLLELLRELGCGELVLCGMMTQNCVTHTALSRRADLFEKVTVLTDACTTVTEMLHAIALHALSTRVTMARVEDLEGLSLRAG